MDPTQVVSDVSQTLGESTDTVEAAFRVLFHLYPGPAPNDWSDVEQALYAQPPVEHAKVGTLLDALKGLDADAGSADDPRVILDDYELRGYFAPQVQAPAADEPAATPVADGSLINRVGDDYYLGDTQVWQAGSGDSVYYHDGTQNYDTLGRPLQVADTAVPDAATPAAGQPEDHEAWNAYLAENGPRWDGTEPAWQQFRDWFVYDADQHQVGTSAQGFIALAESGDKRAVFAQYGVALPDAAASETGAAPEDLLHRLHLEVLEPALEHALRTDPSLAELGEERLRELLAEVAAEHLARYA